LKITSFEVLHYPVEPSLAFKIEYKGRSIIISGDTIFSDDLLQQSMNVDVLFHEVMNIGLLESMRKGAKAVGNDVIDIVLFDVQDYHIPVGHLIFYHALPAPRNQIMEKIFYRNIDKDFQNWTASIDGTTVTLPVGSDEIILSLTE
jgi:ribonuclease Z